MADNATPNLIKLKLKDQRVSLKIKDKKVSLKLPSEEKSDTLEQDLQDPKRGGKRDYQKDRISDDGYIYTPYITVNGRQIWHPTGGVFRFLPKEN